MGTTIDEIREWLKRGHEEGAAYMIVVCDTYDYEDYPVYVMPGTDVKTEYQRYNEPDKMSRVMEVYSYAKDLERQLGPHRVKNFE